MNSTETLSGTIDRILFHNEENGFAVFVLQINSKTNLRQGSGGQADATVRGYVPSIHAGEQVTLKGAWVTHPKFGRQFEAQQCTAHVPTSLIGLKKYLGSGLIKGIGPVYAEKLVNYFGQDVLEIIDKDPERLKEVPGIGKGRVEKIVTAC